eukprot:scaffold118892_cov32-Tisochrysis_lutea.AAC.4
MEFKKQIRGQFLGAPTKPKHVRASARAEYLVRRAAPQSATNVMAKAGSYTMQRECAIKVGRGGRRAERECGQGGGQQDEVDEAVIALLSALSTSSTGTDYSRTRGR